MPAFVIVPVIGVAGLLPAYCDEADEGGGETNPLNAFTRVGGPGVEGFVGLVVVALEPDPVVPTLFVMAAGALFNRLMIVELLLLLPPTLGITFPPVDCCNGGGGGVVIGRGWLRLPVGVVL